MTSEATATRPAADRRDGWRRELADLLDVTPAALTDEARLGEDLGLDSLARMSLLAWLDGKGVSLMDPRILHRVDDVLKLIERVPARSNVSVVMLGAVPGGEPGRAGDVPEPRRPRSPLAPVLGNHAYQLTPLRESDIGFLYALAVHPETSYRWRYRGVPPPPDRFAADLWSQVLVQYVVRTHSDEPVGQVVAYAADLAAGHAYVGAVFQPDHTGSGLAADVTATFVRYLFHTFPLRKLYLEVPGFNWPQVRSAAGRLFEIEGVLRDHDFYAGRYWDKYVCAIYPVAPPNPSD